MVTICNYTNSLYNSFHFADSILVQILHKLRDNSQLPVFAVDLHNYSIYGIRYHIVRPTFIFPQCVSVITNRQVLVENKIVESFAGKSRYIGYAETIN